MLYRNTFINENLRIKVYTRSKRISQLINNFLDFNNTCYSKSQIKIDFYLDEVNLKNTEKEGDDSKRFLCRGWLQRNNNLSLSLGNTIANVIASPETNVVKGEIFKFDESLKERILDFVFTQPLQFILAYHSLFFLHSSMLCKNNDCILILGEQNAGKSTLALVLSRSFDLLADDDCFIKPTNNGIVLYPFPTKMGLKDKVLNRYPELKKHILKNYRYGGKHRLSLNSISSNSNHPGARRCKMIIFPRYREGEKVCLKEMSREEALDRLTDNSSRYPKEKAQEAFWALCSLTKGANSFKLSYDDEQLDEIPKIIQEAFNRCYN